jgi:hypothetical protein
MDRAAAGAAELIGKQGEEVFMKSSVQVCLCMALAALAAVPAGASTFLYVPQEELVAQAQAVVQGRVVEVNSFWNRQGTAILTEAVVEVEDTLLGRDVSHVRLITFGGEVGGYGIEAHGFPTFRKGQRLLVFLEPARAGEDGAHRVLGYRQGQFEIRVNKRGEEVAVPAWEAAEQVRILKPDGTEAAAPRAIPLAQLKSRIRETAERAGRADVRPETR